MAKQEHGRWTLVAPVLAGLFLAVVAGSITSHLGVPPGKWINKGTDIARDYHRFVFEFNQGKVDGDNSVLLNVNLYRRVREKGKGVLRHDPSKAFEGLTLVTSAHAPAAVLMDMEGGEVHRWEKGFFDIWPEPEHLAGQRLVDPRLVNWRDVHLFPNGEVLVVFEGMGNTPYGYGLVKLDRDSEVIWRYGERVHHEATVGPDGRIYTLIHDVLNEPLAEAPFVRVPTLRDWVVVLSAEGEELRRVSLLDAFATAGYRHYLDAVARTKDDDPLHANAVRPISAAFASANGSFAREGDVIVSLLQPNVLASVDLESGTLQWVSAPAMQRQHDPDLLENGNIMLFDNKGDFPEGGISRVLEYDPESNRLVWMFHGRGGEQFASLVRSSQQLLPNGNVLITESDAGRLLEVTREGEIVWEWVNPERLKEGRMEIAIPIVNVGMRFRREELTFLVEASAESP